MSGERCRLTLVPPALLVTGSGVPHIRVGGGGGPIEIHADSLIETIGFASPSRATSGSSFCRCRARDIELNRLGGE